MAVQSYLSLYTWLLGWQLYDQIWAILANLGFIAIPFAVIAVKSVYEPAMSGVEFKKLGDVAIVRMTVLILLALIVLVFAGVPMVELKPSQVNYTPTCVQNPKTVTPNNTGTTYDNIITIPGSIKVPLWWYVVMAMSNGLTDQTKSLLTCPVVDLRSLQTALVTTNIKYADTKAELLRFRKECWIPAYNRYLEDEKDKTKSQSINQALAQYGGDDVNWVGSYVFQSIAGFYDSLYAQSPVVGFPYSGSDQDAIQSQTGQPQWGTPSCKYWWQYTDFGLREKLFIEFSKDTRAKLAEVNGGGYKDLDEDAAIRVMIQKSTGGGFLNRGYSSEEDNTRGNSIGRITSMIGTDYASLTEFPKIHMLQNMLPILQALLEFMLFALMPIILVFSGYSMRFIFAASFFMFALIFWSFLLSLVTYLDNFLMEAMYQTWEGGKLVPGRFVQNLMAGEVNPNANLLDMVISLFYVGAELVFLFFASWIGWKSGNAVTGMGSMEGIAGGGGKHGGGLAGKIAMLVK